jgi:hypothetical protein
MKPPRDPRPARTGQRGSALLAVMCFATVLALALTTFQALCNQTLKTSNRNAQSTHAIELSEMGMEYALWCRSNASWTGWTTSGSTASLTLSGSDFNFSNGATGSVALNVTNYNVTSYNYSTSTLPTSVVTATSTVTLADGSTVSRQLKSTLQKAQPFSNAVAGILTYNGATAYGGTVTMNSGGSRIDSYSSSTSPTAATTDYAAIVMATTSVSMSTNALINGYVATSPNGSGNVALTYSTNSTASKLKGPSTAAATNIDTSRQTTSPYQNVFDIAAPGSGTSLSAPSGTVYLGSYNTKTVYRTTNLYVDSGTFVIDGSDPDGNGVSDATDINGDGSIDSNDYRNDVVIVLTGSFQVYPGTGNIVIRNGGSLKVLIAGSFIVHTGGIDNQTRLPKNLALIGTGTSTLGYSSYIYSPTKFYGTIYAPRHDFTFYGYNSASEFFGAIVASDVVIYPLSSSNLKVHYDKDLASEVFRDIDTPYTIQSGTLKEYDVNSGSEL